MARMAFEAFPRALDSNGNPVSGGLLYVYEAGTTTPVTTYSDEAETTPHAHPVVADSAGFFPEIYLPVGTYKVMVKTAAEVTIDEADNVVQPRTLTHYTTVAAIVASTETSRGLGEIWEAGRYRYEEASSGGHITTAGGVELNVLPQADGSYAVEAFNISGSRTSAQNTAALLTAFGLADSTSQVTLSVSDVYDVDADGTLDITGSITIKGNGRQTGFNFASGAGAGITWVADTGEAGVDTFVMRDLSLSVSSTMTTMLSLTGETGEANTNVHISNVLFDTPDATYPTTAIYCSAIRNSIFDGVRILMDQTNTTYGMDFAGQCLNTEIRSCTINAVATAIRVRGTCEDFKLVQTHCLNCDYGLDADSDGASAEPALQITGSHFSADVTGVTIGRFRRSHVGGGTTVYLTGTSGTVKGIVIDDSADATYTAESNTIENVLFNQTGTGGTTYKCVDIVNADHVIIANCQYDGESGTICREFGSGAADCMEICARYDGACKTEAGKVVDSGSRNAFIEGPEVERRFYTLATDATASIVPEDNGNIVKHTGTLTANRNISFTDTPAAYYRKPGYTAKITRTGGGAFSLNIKDGVSTTTLKALSTDEWCEVVWDGTNWYLSQYGAL